MTFEEQFNRHYQIYNKSYPGIIKQEVASRLLDTGMWAKENRDKLERIRVSRDFRPNTSVPLPHAISSK